MRIAAVVSLSAGCLWAQLDRPTLGTMLDMNGATRVVFGVAGSATLGDPVVQGALSIVCSRSLCLTKTDTSILSGGQAVDAPPGPALFALDGIAAFVYFPQSNQLARWHDNQLDPVDFNIAGEILSLRAVNGTLEYAVRRDDGTWIVREGNVTVDSLPGASGAVMLLKDGVLFATADAVVVRRTDQRERRFQIAGAVAFLAIGDGYIQIRGASANYVLRLDDGSEKLFLLPGVPQ